MKGKGQILGAVHSLWTAASLCPPFPPESCSVGLFVKPSQLPRVFSFFLHQDFVLGY